MTDELKTLKDFEWFDEDLPHHKNIINSFKQEIKDEAIKRAKYYRIRVIQASTPKTKSYWNGRLKEVMEFNNLTEKDLEEK